MVTNESNIISSARAKKKHRYSISPRKPRSNRHPAQPRCDVIVGLTSSHETGGRACLYRPIYYSIHGIVASSYTRIRPYIALVYLKLAVALRCLLCFKGPDILKRRCREHDFRASQSCVLSAWSNFTFKLPECGIAAALVVVSQSFRTLRFTCVELFALSLFVRLGCVEQEGTAQQVSRALHQGLPAATLLASGAQVGQ